MQELHPDQLPVDETLSQAVIALPYYRETNPVMADDSLRMLRALVA